MHIRVCSRVVGPEEEKFLSTADELRTELRNAERSLNVIIYGGFEFVVDKSSLFLFIRQVVQWGNVEFICCFNSVLGIIFKFANDGCLFLWQPFCFMF